MVSHEPDRHAWPGDLRPADAGSGGNTPRAVAAGVVLVDEAAGISDSEEVVKSR